ncbi:hypothetical protein TNCV_2728861 [Trichonephila clavipes]|nr:hypothetical protein TNCV_2728861 [Trichonephila clavipes]
MGIQSRKCRSCDLWCKEAKKKNKQKHINGRENILSKDCTTIGVRNYDQKFSGHGRLINSSCDQKQTPLTSYSHLQRSCDVEHAYSSNTPGTTAVWRFHYNPHLRTRSVYGSVLRLNTNSSYYPRERIVTFQNVKNSMQRHYRA